MGIFDFFKTKNETKNEIWQEYKQQYGPYNRFEQERFNFIGVEVLKSDMLKNDTDKVLNFINPIFTSKAMKLNHNAFEIMFSGYDFDSRELFEIPEVKRYVQELDRKCPYWFLLLNFNGTALMAIMLCLANAERRHGNIEVDKDNFKRFFDLHAAMLLRLVHSQSVDSVLVRQAIANARAYYLRYGFYC